MPNSRPIFEEGLLIDKLSPSASVISVSNFALVSYSKLKDMSSYSSSFSLEELIASIFDSILFPFLCVKLSLSHLSFSTSDESSVSSDSSSFSPNFATKIFLLGSSGSSSVSISVSISSVSSVSVSSTISSFSSSSVFSLSSSGSSFLSSKASFLFGLDCTSIFAIFLFASSISNSPDPTSLLESSSKLSSM